MTRNEQRQANQKAISRAVALIASREARHSRAPSYRAVIGVLNREGLRNSRNQEWSMKTFYLMLSRHGYRGIYGLNQAYYAGEFND